MKLVLKLFSWFLFFLIPVLCLGQTVDPGSEAHDSAASVRESPDSAHHTDTAHFHYNYSGTGTLNNTNYMGSYIFDNVLKLSLLKQSSALNFTNSWVYGRQNSVLTNNDFTSSLDLGIYKTLKHFYYWALQLHDQYFPAHQ